MENRWIWECIDLRLLGFYIICVQILINERSGKSGRGVVLQDVHAHPQICMMMMWELCEKNASRFWSHNFAAVILKTIKMWFPTVSQQWSWQQLHFNTKYDSEKHWNLQWGKFSQCENHPHTIYLPSRIALTHSGQGTSLTGAKFNVGIGFFGFGYFLKLKYEPTYSTYSWTLDYAHTSDLGKFCQVAKASDPTTSLKQMTILDTGRQCLIQRKRELLAHSPFWKWQYSPNSLQGVDTNFVFHRDQTLFLDSRIRYQLFDEDSPCWGSLIEPLSSSLEQ